MPLKKLTDPLVLEYPQLFPRKLLLFPVVTRPVFVPKKLLFEDVELIPELVPKKLLPVPDKLFAPADVPK